MSVIIDQFEVVLDSQQDQEQKSNAAETTPAPQAALKPHDVAAILMQYQNRLDRVRAH